MLFYSNISMAKKEQLYEAICSKIECGGFEIADLNFKNREEEDEFMELAKNYFSDKDCHNADSYYLRGRHKLDNSDYRGAVEDIDKAFEIGSRTIVVAHRGIAKYGLNDYEGAIDDFNSFILISNIADNNIPSLLFNMRGMSKYNLDRFEDAIEDLNRAIGMDPEIGEYYNNRAKIEGCSGNLDEAIRDHKKAIELEPDRAIFYENLSQTLYTVYDALGDEKWKVEAEEAKKKAKKHGYVD